MESDMVVAVRHRDVPGDLTRSSTCNKTHVLLFIRNITINDSSVYEKLLHFLKIYCSRFSDLRILSCCNRWEKARRRRGRRILRAILATVDGELSNR